MEARQSRGPRWRRGPLTPGFQHKFKMRNCLTKKTPDSPSDRGLSLPESERHPHLILDNGNSDAAQGERPAQASQSTRCQSGLTRARRLSPKQYYRAYPKTSGVRRRIEPEAELLISRVIDPAIYTVIDPLWGMVIRVLSDCGVPVNHLLLRLRPAAHGVETGAPGSCCLQ